MSRGVQDLSGDHTSQEVHICQNVDHVCALRSETETSHHCQENHGEINSQQVIGQRLDDEFDWRPNEKRVLIFD